MVIAGSGPGVVHSDVELWISSNAYNGVVLRSVGDPYCICRIRPVTRQDRRRMLDSLKTQSASPRQMRDPEILTRIAQYEMAFRMQQSTELTDFSDESAETLAVHGPEVQQPGSCGPTGASDGERGVRVVQLLHRGGST